MKAMRAARCAGREKMKKVMHEWKKGELRSGSESGPVVTSQKQAVAIGLSEMRRAAERRKKKG